MYVIRKVGTNLYIPDVKRKFRLKGSSRVEAIPAMERLPRVFKKASHAKGWLTTWCKGIVRYISVDSEYGLEHELHTVPFSQRDKAEYEIVELIDVYFATRSI